MTPEQVDELMQSRLDGESDAHFYAREVRMKCETYLAATAALRKAIDANDVKAIRECHSEVHRAQFNMTGAVGSLYDALFFEAMRQKPELVAAPLEAIHGNS